MKKILLIVPALHQGGFEKVCVTTARLLQPYFQVKIVIFDSRDIAYDIKGIPVADLRLPSRDGKLGKIINVLKRGWRIHKIKKKEEIDIAYSFGPTANLANIASFGKAKKWLGIRSYMDMGKPAQIRLFCKCADKLICCSQVICQEVHEKYGYRGAVTLNNPFDIKEVGKLSETEQVKLPWTNGRIIVTMGREDEVKGFWHLIKSFALVHKRMPDTRLMVIGEGEYLQYKELAERLGVDDSVYFTGLKRNPYPYLKQGSLYVLTSYYEGFPNAMVEAMAVGLPVIATDCMTGPREILEDRYGILVPNMDPIPDFSEASISKEEENLSLKIIELLENPEKMQYYKKMSLERARVYSKESYVKKIREWAE